MHGVPVPGFIGTPTGKQRGRAGLQLLGSGETRRPVAPALCAGPGATPGGVGSHTAPLVSAGGLETHHTAGGNGAQARPPCGPWARCSRCGHITVQNLDWPVSLETSSLSLSRTRMASLPYREYHMLRLLPR